ncbi:PREDICTED: vicilin-like seed storage protein At2g18540 [Ipomoea nil]|uniref:vicilin-like seed storage protein At2g18540 n=1 Tax=Ipomoea nil TaxID=35883 RepID=UPI0009018916|nr:PREDICTED: vicilin-like seed storage protein At2g18540 [Ipomoea nil]
MAKKSSVFFFIVFIVAALIVSLSALKEAAEEEEEGGDGRRPGFQTRWPFLVKKWERKTTVKTENGEVSTVRISDGIANGWYHIEFITLEPNSVFLPVLLQADMVFYVHTGSGRISWTDDDETKKVELRRGDIYRLKPGTLFYIESSLEMERQKLRIHALFANAETDLHEPAATGPYTSIRNLILGFDRIVLEAAFGVSGKPIEELVSSPDPGAIVHGFSNEKKTTVVVFEFMKAILGSSSIFQSQNNKKKTKTYNVFSHDPDFENCNGWSTIVSKKRLHALKDLDVSVFMVNLTKGSMMGPHWNPRATELGICLSGPGIVRVVCSSAANANAKQTGCKNMRFYVEEGDVFAVPRFHPMAQMAFNNHSFVFMGFSTSSKKNHPQYLAGKASVLRTLPRDVVAVSFGASNETMDLVLDKQEEAIILDCTSCAEEELRIMTEEIEKAKEEARKKKEEEEIKREEEETKRAEEEEAKKEEAARQKEAKEREEQEKEEAEREKQEERKREQEAKRAEEEEAARQKEAKEREEQEKEEAAREKQEEERKREEEEEEEEEAMKEEEEAARRAEEEAARRAKEEAEREKQETRRAEEEEAREEEEERQREAKERAEEEARQREAKKQEEQQRREAAEEEERRWAEEEEARKEEEAMQREAKKREEAARQQEEEMQQQQQHEGGGGWGGDHPGKEWGRRILKT